MANWGNQGTQWVLISFLRALLNIGKASRLAQGLIRLWHSSLCDPWTHASYIVKCQAVKTPCVIRAALHCGQWQTAGPLSERFSRSPPASAPGSSSSTRGLLLFTFLSIRTVKTSRSLSGSLLSTRPWLNSCTGWFRRAVRFELDRPISFPLRGCSSAAIFSGRPVFATLRFATNIAMVYGTSPQAMWLRAQLNYSNLSTAWKLSFSYKCLIGS